MNVRGVQFTHRMIVQDMLEITTLTLRAMLSFVSASTQENSSWAVVTSNTRVLIKIFACKEIATKKIGKGVKE